MRIHLRSCNSAPYKVERKKQAYPEAFPDLYQFNEQQEMRNDAVGEKRRCVAISDQDERHAPGIQSIVSQVHEGSNIVLEVPTEEAQTVILLKLKLGRMGRATSQQEVNEIINLLSRPSFHLDSFLSSCANYNNCKIQEELTLQNSFNSIGFSKIALKDPVSEVYCDLYLRSTLEVLRNQIAGASTNTSFFQSPEPNGKFNHPMTADLGQSGLKAVSSAVMRSLDDENMWHNEINSNESSFVGLVQVYSDKSKTSLKESAFQLYPLHATLLNFHEEYRRKCIVNGSTFLVFLPISFYSIIDGIKQPAKVDRAQKLCLLHQAMDVALNEIRELGYPGFTCRDNQATMRRCHPCLVSYCCDLPEAKDLTSIRNGNSSEKNCHRCLAESKQFNNYTNCSHRTGSFTVNTILKARKLRDEGRKEAADSLMDEYSLTDQIPSLNKMPFLELHPTLDMHYIFTFEPLHGFNLGISRELKKCLSERLRSDSLSTDTLPTKKGVYRTRTFKTARMIILNAINRMLSHIQRSSSAKGLRIDFSSTSKGDNGNGLYGKDGKLVGMLESKDYRSLDMVFPFVGMLCDRCCGEESSAPSTRLFVQYVDIMQSSMSYRGSQEWCNEKILELERMIIRFKRDAKTLYSDHQVSQLCTEKFHMLDHICEDIRRLGGIKFGDAGLYEYAHTLVKNAYRSGSKRRNSAMDETVLSFLKEMNYSSLHALFISKRTNGDNQCDAKSTSGNPANDEAIRTDCSVLVKRGDNFSLHELLQCRKAIRKLRKAKERNQSDEVNRFKNIINAMTEVVVAIVRDVSEDGCRVLCRQILSTVNMEGESPTTARTLFVSRVISGYVPGIESPLGEDYNHETKRILLRPSNIRYSQRLVSGRGFYGSPLLRQDCVVIQGEDENDAERINMWVARVLLLLRLPIPDSEHIGDRDISQQEYAFVQYFEAQPHDTEIDRALGCVKLRWARDESDGGDRMETRNVDPARKWFDRIPISYIRGVVHVIRGDYGSEGKGIIEDIDSVPWYDQVFFINRFYCSPERQRYFHEE